IGFANGVIALGSPKTGADYLDKAPGSFQDKIIRTPEKDSIYPLSIRISDFESGIYDNLLIRLDSVQFTDEVMYGGNVTFASSEEDDYDALRTIIQAYEGEKTNVITSTFADFK